HQLAASLLEINGEDLFFKLLEAFANWCGIGQFIEAVSPRVGNELAFHNRAVPAVHGQRFQADLLGKAVADFALVDESSPGGVSGTLIFHQVSIAAPMRLFFKQQEITVLEEISSRKAAHASAHDDHVMPCRGGRTSEDFAVEDLMADVGVFALDGRSFGILCLRQQRKVNWASGGKAAGYDGFK